MHVGNDQGHPMGSLLDYPTLPKQVSIGMHDTFFIGNRD